MYWQVACFCGFRLGSPLSGFARVNFAGKRGQVLSDWLAFGIAVITFGASDFRAVEFCKYVTIGNGSERTGGYRA